MSDKEKKVNLSYVEWLEQALAEYQPDWICDELVCDDGWCENHCRSDWNRKCLKRYYSKYFDTANTQQSDDFFREPTAEERKAVAEYIESISIPTGVNVFDLMDEPPTERSEKMEYMEYRAHKIVLEYIQRHLDKSDDVPTNIDVYTVWKCKALQNWKFLISSSLLDGMYYELTFNGDKNEWYLDAYKKFENQVIREYITDIPRMDCG